MHVVLEDVTRKGHTMEKTTTAIKKLWRSDLTAIPGQAHVVIKSVAILCCVSV
jgi:hypothetical protein